MPRSESVLPRPRRIAPGPVSGCGCSAPLLPDYVSTGRVAAGPLRDSQESEATATRLRVLRRCARLPLPHVCLRFCVAACAAACWAASAAAWLTACWTAWRIFSSSCPAFVSVVLRASSTIFAVCSAACWTTLRTLDSDTRSIETLIASLDGVVKLRVQLLADDGHFFVDRRLSVPAKRLVEVFPDVGGQLRHLARHGGLRLGRGRRFGHDMDFALGGRDRRRWRHRCRRPRSRRWDGGHAKLGPDCGIPASGAVGFDSTGVGL